MTFHVPNIKLGILSQFDNIDTETIIKAAIIQTFTTMKWTPNDFTNPIVCFNPNDDSQYKIYATNISTKDAMFTYIVLYGGDVIHIEEKIW